MESHDVFLKLGD